MSPSSWSVTKMTYHNIKSDNKTFKTLLQIINFFMLVHLQQLEKMSIWLLKLLSNVKAFINFRNFRWYRSIRPKEHSTFIWRRPKNFIWTKIRPKISDNQLREKHRPPTKRRKQSQSVSKTIKTQNRSLFNWRWKERKKWEKHKDRRIENKESQREEEMLLRIKIENVSLNFLYLIKWLI